MIRLSPDTVAETVRRIFLPNRSTKSEHKQHPISCTKATVMLDIAGLKLEPASEKIVAVYDMIAKLPLKTAKIINVTAIKIAFNEARSAEI